MLSLSEISVLSLIWGIPWGQLSACPCPVPRAERISHGHTHPSPREKGLCKVTHHPQGSPYPLELSPTEEAEAAQPQTSSSLLGLSGQWGCTALVGPTVPKCAGDRAACTVPQGSALQTSSREGALCTGSTIQGPGFSPLCKSSCLHPGQTLVTLARQPKHPLISCEMELGPGCQRTQTASSWPPCCFSHCLWDIINFLCWKGSFQLSRDPLGLKVSESDFQSTGHPFLSREKQQQHSLVPWCHAASFLDKPNSLALSNTSRHNPVLCSSMAQGSAAWPCPWGQLCWSCRAVLPGGWT